MYTSSSRVISYVFHPLLLSTTILAILFFVTPTIIQPYNENAVWPLLITVFVLTFVMPSLSLLLLKFTRVITSIELEERSERLVPFGFILLYYGLAAYLFFDRLSMSQVLVVIYISISVLIVLLTLLTFFYKVSIHAAGTWGMVGFLFALHLKFPEFPLLWPLIIAIIAAGATSSARLQLNCHSLPEVLIGAGTGLFISFVSIMLFI